MSTTYNHLKYARNLGVDASPLGNIDRIKASEPFLKDVKELGEMCEGGIQTSTSMTGNRMEFKTAMTTYLKNINTVKFVFGEGITDIQNTDHGAGCSVTGTSGDTNTADVCVITANSAVRDLAEKRKLIVPLLTYKVNKETFR